MLSGFDLLSIYLVFYPTSGMSFHGNTPKALSFPQLWPLPISISCILHPNHILLFLLFTLNTQTSSLLQFNQYSHCIHITFISLFFTLYISFFPLRLKLWSLILIPCVHSLFPLFYVILALFYFLRKTQVLSN